MASGIEVEVAGDTGTGEVKQTHGYCQEADN